MIFRRGSGEKTFLEEGVGRRHEQNFSHSNNHSHISITEAVQQIKIHTLSGSDTFCVMDQKSGFVSTGRSMVSVLGKNCGPLRFLCTLMVTSAVVLRSGFWLS